MSKADHTPRDHWEQFAYEPFDVATCATEPIRFCGAIQAGGYVVLCHPNTRVIEMASRNCAELFGQSDLAHVIGRDVFDFIKPEDPDAMTLNAAVNHSASGAIRAKLGEGTATLHASFYEVAQGVLIDIEPVLAVPDGSAHRYVDELRKLVHQVDNEQEMTLILARAAGQVRKLAGYDRVMIYRFEQNWDGEVVAEDRADHLESWLGLCYPESDIPASARQLYMESRYRMIISTERPPVPIGTRAGLGRSEIDLSASSLRAVSPIHVQYLRNMGVRASFSVPIRVNGRLWGLIACHHYAEDRHLPREIRSGCELAGQVLGGRLADFISERRLRQRNRVYEFSQNLLSLVSEGQAAVQAFANEAETLLDLTQSSGAYVRVGGSEMNIGVTPDAAVTAHLLTHLRQDHGLGLWCTRSLSSDLKGGGPIDPAAIGALAVPLSFGFEDVFIWFRPEAIETITWGGRPDAGKANRTLDPRSSFAAWTETVRGRSRIWSDADLEAAQHLLFTFVKGIFKKAAELSKANTELEIVTRAKDEFIGMVSHELRTPLGVMIGWIDILKDEGLQDPKLKQALDIIDRNARLQINLINDLLDISRIIAGKMRLSPEPNVEISTVVREVITGLQPTAHAKNVAVFSDLAERTFVSADSERLRQVVWNLLSNAIKFTPKGGRIQVSVRREASSYLIEVSDNGLGIAPDQLNRIFNRFAQAQDAHAQIGGLGLGLSIVKALVELHGGRIEATSPGLGGGSTFTATFPIFAVRAEEPTPGATSSPATEPPPPEFTGLRILVAEDQPEAALALKHVLERMGARVTLAASGRDALARLRTEPHDLLLSDIGMPDGDGYELIKSWRALERERRASPLPALALTAYATSRDRTRCLEAGFQNHIPKPVDRQELLAVIRSLGVAKLSTS